MSQTLKYLRALADPTRLRILALLGEAELSVNELQEITGMGQSRISTHLGVLVETGLLESERKGKRTFYKRRADEHEGNAELAARAIAGADEIEEREADRVNLRRVLDAREHREQAYFNQVAGRFDRSYGPGRSWQAFGHMLLRLLPPLEVADLGSGEGLLSELLARRCKRVIAVDNSDKMVAFGAKKARKNGLKNLEFRLGDLENPPIEANSVDLAILSQALHHAENPEAAIVSAARILRKGGQIMILDLHEHSFAKAGELYGDRWPGFAKSDLQKWLEKAGLREIEITIVARESESPYFETILAVGVK